MSGSKRPPSDERPRDDRGHGNRSTTHRVAGLPQKLRRPVPTLLVILFTFGLGSLTWIARTAGLLDRMGRTRIRTQFRWGIWLTVLSLLGMVGAFILGSASSIPDAALVALIIGMALLNLAGLVGPILLLTAIIRIFLSVHRLEQQNGVPDPIALPKTYLLWFVPIVNAIGAWMVVYDTQRRMIRLVDHLRVGSPARRPEPLRPPKRSVLPTNPGRRTPLDRSALGAAGLCLLSALLLLAATAVPLSGSHVTARSQFDSEHDLFAQYDLRGGEITTTDGEQENEMKGTWDELKDESSAKGVGLIVSSRVPFFGAVVALLAATPLIAFGSVSRTIRNAGAGIAALGGLGAFAAPIMFGIGTYRFGNALVSAVAESPIFAEASPTPLLPLPGALVLIGGLVALGGVFNLIEKIEQREESTRKERESTGTSSVLDQTAFPAPTTRPPAKAARSLRCPRCQRSVTVALDGIPKCWGCGLQARRATG